jgi:hypothetical protein
MHARQHQAETPCFVVSQDDAGGSNSQQGSGRRKTLHIALHDGASDGFAHYNSVRMMSEGDDGPARVSVLGAQVGEGDAKRAVADDSDANAVSAVMRGTGCSDADRVKQMLLSLDHDVDAAIEAIIAGCEPEPGDAAGASQPACLPARQAGDDQGAEQAQGARLPSAIKESGGGGAGDGASGSSATAKTKMQEKREAKAAKAAAKRAEKRERVVGSDARDALPSSDDASHSNGAQTVLANGIRVLSI